SAPGALHRSTNSISGDERGENAPSTRNRSSHILKGSREAVENPGPGGGCRASCLPGRRFADGREMQTVHYLRCVGSCRGSSKPSRKGPAVQYPAIIDYLAGPYLSEFPECFPRSAAMWANRRVEPWWK